MCGICGKLNFDPDRGVARALVKSMADQIAHRGPDDEGYYLSGPIGLGFRRLSIIDLNTGHQPLSNEDGTVHIVFNGEIYNYRELRAELLGKGHTFQTETDTEVIVHLYEEMGENCVEKLRGMFGFAIWDERRRQLFLARDRVGIKPLYYWLGRDSIVFGSEMKAILADPAIETRVRPEMVERFLRFYYVPGEETLLANIHKLPPGSTMVVKAGKVKIRQYWDLRFDPTPRKLEAAQEELFELVDESVRLHMISDVPVGLLLSGGVDSTAMLAFAAGKTEQRLSTFTLGFASQSVADERPYARLAARRYGTEHHEMTISAKDFAEFLPRYAWYMEEPVCEAPAIALYYVSKMAREFVKVLISGEGGDEAFGGYQTYRGVASLERLKKALGPLNGPVSGVLSAIARRFGSSRAAKYAPLMTRPLADYYYSRNFSPASLFNADPMRVCAGGFGRGVNRELALRSVRRHLDTAAGYGTINRMLYVDTKTSLPDDLLLKADKMTMATSIELRVPFLDHKVLEFAGTLPENFKVRGLTTKFIAKKTFRNLVPDEILNRPKAGFPVPFGNWLRTDLRDLVHDVLLDRATVERGYFTRQGLEGLIRAHAESGGYAKEILSLVSLELWHRAFLKPAPEPVPAGSASPVLA